MIKNLQIQRSWEYTPYNIYLVKSARVEVTNNTSVDEILAFCSQVLSRSFENYRNELLRHEGTLPLNIKDIPALFKYGEKYKLHLKCVAEEQLLKQKQKLVPLGIVEQNKRVKKRKVRAITFKALSEQILTCVNKKM
jgi:hypothetical protein